MTSSRFRPERFGRMLAGLVRQLEFPFFDGRGTAPPDDGGRGRETPPTTPRGSKPRRIQLGERALDYAFRRGRRRTIGFTVNADGLTVAAPRWVGIAEVEEAIREREAWIFTKLAEMQRHRAATPQVRWEEGGTFPYLGETITLRLTSSTRRAISVIFDRGARTLTVSLPPDASATQLKDRVQAWLQNEARALFRERLAVFEARLGVRHRVLRLSSAKTRWGSCSADGRILLNWRLIHFPLSSIDYVVAHELAHLKEMNHSPRFWATVADILPEYQSAREHMKQPPPELLPML
jgi:predicted metal-dependent hydrolase